MKKITLLLFILAWLGTGQSQAQKLKKKSAWSGIKSQNLLAGGTWSVTSTQQQRLAEFNGELESQSKQVDISYEKGNFKFQISGDPKNSFSVKAEYDKSELGVVYFVPKNKAFDRITIHKKDKLIVVEYADLSMSSYQYGELGFQN